MAQWQSKLFTNNRNAFKDFNSVSGSYLKPPTFNPFFKEIQTGRHLIIIQTLYR